MEPTEQRRAAREPLPAQVSLRKPKELAYAVDLHNLSPHGCCVALRERLLPGQLLWITIPGLESLQSWIRWQGEWHAGIEFERPMHVAVFDHFAARLRQGVPAPRH